MAAAAATLAEAEAAAAAAARVAAARTEDVETARRQKTLAAEALMAIETPAQLMERPPALLRARSVRRNHR